MTMSLGMAPGANAIESSALMQSAEAQVGGELADPRTSQPDPYASHLADVNDSREVIAIEDILTPRGQLLVRKHGRIDHACAQRLLEHRLQYPLEAQVKLKNAFDRSAWLDEYSAFLVGHGDIQTAQQQLQFGAEFQALIQNMRLPDIISQKMTVMKLRLPEQFQRALFSSWLAALMAREMGLDKDEIHAAFIAGLTHDIGFLHISPAVLNSQAEASVNDWREIQSHVVIGERVLRGHRELPASVPRAVLEHHERCDGTGYPAAKEESDLSVLGQIVAMADALQALRMGSFAKTGRNLRDALPFLRLNSNTHFYDTYRAVVDVLRKSGLEPTPVRHPSGSSHAIPQLMFRIDNLKQAVNAMGGIVRLLRGVQIGPKGRIALRAFNQVLACVTSSGMVRDELLGWVELIGDDVEDAVVLEINEIELMQNELVWQISSAQRTFNAFLERECNADSGLQSKLRMYNEQLRESQGNLSRH